MVHETYETILLDGNGNAVELADGQVWNVTKTQIHIHEDGGERYIATAHWVVLA